ncbi:hypothetical protein ACF3NR_01165 [Vaginella massiliensis]|uniref:hypothetical protein n=1 Tax=Vaginella massiliensis TaxID=1816680 RepID=UPI000838837B|nr:hypothetical protein [Vaginella massiliensis]
MNYTFILLPLLLIAPFSLAQVNVQNQTVQIVPKWSVGNTYEYHFKNDDFIISINDTVSKVYTNSKKKMSVVDENQFVYKMQWEITDYQTNDPDEFYKDFLTNSKNVSYEFATNKDGEYLELLNETKVQTQLIDIVSKMKKKNKKNAVYQSNVDGLMEMISANEYVQYALSQELHNLLQYNGLFLQMGEKYVGKQVQDNFFGYPIASTTTTWLDSINEENLSYTIASTQELDKDDFENLWKFMAQNMLDQSNVKLTKEQVEREISKYSDTIELKVDNRSTYNKDSILVNSQYRFSLNIGTRKTINMLEIQLMQNEV